MHIDFQDQTRAVAAEYIDLLQRLMIYAGKKESIASAAEVSVTFVSNEQITEINRNYRQQDRATDVISFALQENIAGETEIVDTELPLILGDIVISLDKAKEQAEEYGHSLERELSFLAVHGLLHLLGYDHMNPQDEKKMFNRQEQILSEFGIER